MKFKFSYLQENPILGSPEAIYREYEFDKIIVLNNDMTFEIRGKTDSERQYSYPSTILESLIIGVKNGEKEVIGFFPKILIFQRLADNQTEIVSICGRYTREEIDNYFINNKEVLKELKNIDVQFISADDAMIKFESIYYSFGRDLFKKEKDVQ